MTEINQLLAKFFVYLKTKNPTVFAIFCIAMMIILSLDHESIIHINSKLKLFLIFLWGISGTSTSDFLNNKPNENENNNISSNPPPPPPPPTK